MQLGFLQLETGDVCFETKLNAGLALLERADLLQANISANNGCGHIWDLTLVKGFNRGKKDVNKFYYSKTHQLTEHVPDGFQQKCVTQMMSLRTGDNSYDIP